MLTWLDAFFIGQIDCIFNIDGSLVKTDAWLNDDVPNVEEAFVALILPL